MIKLAVKKVFCPKCLTLRRVKDVKTGAKVQFKCIKCNTAVWQKEGLVWKYSQSE